MKLMFNKVAALLPYNAHTITGPQGSGRLILNLHWICIEDGIDGCFVADNPDKTKQNNHF